MRDTIDLSSVLRSTDRDSRHRLRLFAFLGLGVVESLGDGALSAVDAVGVFFNVQNCLYVRKELGNKTADEVMSRGIQLHDLFESLSEEDAQKEYQKELSAMRSLCLRLLGRRRAVA